MGHHSFCLIFDILENKSVTVILNGLEQIKITLEGLSLYIKLYITISTENL